MVRLNKKAILVYVGALGISAVPVSALKITPGFVLGVGAVGSIAIAGLCFPIRITRLLFM